MKLCPTLAVCIVISLLASLNTPASAAITSPNDLGGTVLWLDASDPATVIQTTDPGFVEQWTDKSLVGTNNMSQSVLADKPATGAYTLGGLNVLTFAGGSDYFAGPAPLAAGDDDYTYFAVWRPSTAAGVFSVYEQAGPGVGARSSILAVNGKYGFNGQNRDRHDLVPFAANEWRLTALTVDNSGSPNIRIYDNGNSYAGTTTGNMADLNIGAAGAVVGKKQQTVGSEFFNGDLAELIVYDRVLATAEQNDVIGYLDQKYTNVPEGPSLIPGNVLWLDANDVNGDFVPDSLPNGTSVGTWADKSPFGSPFGGGGGSVSQANAALQPQVQTNANLGGLPVVRFDGADWLGGPPVLAGGDDTYTYIAVWQPDTTAGGQVVFEQSQYPSAVNTRSSILAVNGKYGFNGQNNDRHDLVPFGANDLRVTMMTIDNSRPENVQIVDNGQLYAGTTSGNNGDLNIGATGTRVAAKLTTNGENLDGDIAEILVFDRVLTSAELVQIDQYIGQKYGLGGPAVVPAPLHQWTFEDGTADDSVGRAHGTLNNGATVVDGKLVLDGENDFMSTAVLADATGSAETITAKTLVAWVALDNLAQAAAGVLTIENPAGADVFDSIVFGEVAPGKWMNGSNSSDRTQSPQTFGILENMTDPESVMIAIAYGADNSVTVYRDGMVYGQYTKGALQTYSTADGSDVLLGLRHADRAGDIGGTAMGGDAFLAGSIDEARIYGVALSQNQIQAILLEGPTPVPEPGTFVLLTLGLAGLLAMRRRKR